MVGEREKKNKRGERGKKRIESSSSTQKQYGGHVDHSCLIFQRPNLKWALESSQSFSARKSPAKVSRLPSQPGPLEQPQGHRDFSPGLRTAM